MVESKGSYKYPIKQEMNILKLGLFIFIFLLTSCLPEDSSRSGRSTQTSGNDSGSESTGETDINNIPDNSSYEGIVYFQNGSTVSSTGLSFSRSFNQAFILKGDPVHLYLKNNSSNTSFCFLAQFSQAQSPNLLGIKAQRKSYYDYTKQSIQFYLELQLSEEVSSGQVCGTTTISNQIQQVYPGSIRVSSLEDLCTSCQQLSSTSLKIIDTSGKIINAIDLSSMSLSIFNSTSSGGSSGTTIGSCDANNPCGSNYDCCQFGQCVKHGELKAGIDANNAYVIAALQVIQAGQADYNNYGQYFYYCSNQLGTSTGGSGSGSSTGGSVQAAYELEKLTDLYNCLKDSVDEMAICPITYENASQFMDPSQSGVPSFYDFTPRKDDLNSSSVNSLISTTEPSVVKVKYAGSVLYDAYASPLIHDSSVVFSGTNIDNYSVAQSVKVAASPPTSPAHDDLTLLYKINKTCLKEGNYTRCQKIYNIGQNSSPHRPSDSNVGQTVFKLPYHANTSSFANYIILKVDDVIIATSPSTWQLVGSQIQFTSGYLLLGQKVEISYISNLSDTYFETLNYAQSQADMHCGTANHSWTLDPVYNTSGVITQFNCTPIQEPTTYPLERQVAVSTKSAPHHFFNDGGLRLNSTSVTQASTQEGTSFKYDTPYSEPNSLYQYIGFNEIYGALNGSGNGQGAFEVGVEKGKLYDIYVSDGSYTPCPANICTTTPYGIQRLFPETFQFDAGKGYEPDLLSTNRYSNDMKYRADDLLFGRACFVPATMIPWSHVQGATPTEQRRNRLEAQHALFSNGYQRDWYGFDYGALIGSFDGVTWFAIGSKRRVTAKTNKLYLAVNGYFSDLVLDGTYSTRIHEVTNPLALGADIVHDLDSDGAQCQKNHICDTDNDCITQLGYEYSCQVVTSIETPWPKFDNNANEVIGVEYKNISDLVGGANGEIKRCVYRGRGAPCQFDPSSTSANYSDTNIIGLKSCSHNTYCADIHSESFNSRIQRITNSPVSQNYNQNIVNEIGESDRYGLGARLLGRPLHFYGDEFLTTLAQNQLEHNLVEGICVPGKEVDSTYDSDSNSQIVSNYNAQNSAIPSTKRADKILGIGVTPKNTDLQPEYYNSCPVVDENKNFIKHSYTTTPLADSSISAFAGTQNLSTSALSHLDFLGLEIFNDEASAGYIETFGLEENRCLRAAGASCFSDLECAPSSYIANKVRSLASDEGDLNPAEIEFWQEELVCGQPESKYSGTNSLSVNPNYDLKKNRCCRQVGNDISIYAETLNDSSSPNTAALPGVDISLNNSQRYSRVHTVYDLLKSYEVRPLVQVQEDSDSSSSISEVANLLSPTTPLYKTFHAMASRTCCSENWVRKFHEDNGGGIKWGGASKMQSIDKEIFKNISWNPKVSIPGLTDVAFECDEDNLLTSACEVKNLTSAEEDFYLSYLEKFELLGIPQVLIPIKSGDHPYAQKVVNDDQLAPPAINDEYLGDFFDDSVIPEVKDNGSNTYASAGDIEDFKGNLKPIFSDKEVRCCQPIEGTGSQPLGTTDDMCCSGTYSTDQRRCCLPDFTDVSVYLNRYVSSEAAHLSDSHFDPQTGYIKNVMEVLMMATNPNNIGASLCCSGSAMLGVAINNLPVHGDGDLYNSTTGQIETYRRFTYRDFGETSAPNASGESLNVSTYYDAGVRWNNHVYCVPSNSTGSGSSGSSSSGQ